MAKVAELLRLHLDPEEDDDDDDDDDEYLDPPTYWSSASSFDPDLLVPVFSSNFSLSRIAEAPFDPYDSDQDSESRSDYQEDQVSLSLDLFDRCTPMLHGETLDPPDFNVFEGVEEMGSDYLGLGLGFGLESVFERQENGEFSQSGESSAARLVDGQGLRIVEFGSDSDSDDDEQFKDLSENSLYRDVPDFMGDDIGLPLHWDCLRIEESRRDLNDEFEWEEVDGRLDEMEGLSMVIAADLERSLELEEEVVRTIEWEVLLAVNNLGRNPTEDVESYLGDDHDDYVYTSEYEVLFGQFTGHESSLKGNPPAAKLVVENLPSVVLTKEDLANNTLCAVCKDEISIEEKAKRLPCSHHYHAECILPWLVIRNTCPVCRYELPTDDPEYENWRARRASIGDPVEESRARYDFELFPEV